MIGAFNRMPFNRPETVEIYGSFVIESDGEVSALANVMVSPSFLVDLSADMIFSAVREQFGAFLIAAVAEIEAAGTRERTGQFTMEATLETNFSAGRYHVEVIEFSGEFKPGDKIVIDNERLTITLNGQNAMHLMSGDFFDLNTGENEIIYTDEQSGRTVRMRITYRDRYV
jgi:hypothetical protein